MRFLTFVCVTILCFSVFHEASAQKRGILKVPEAIYAFGSVSQGEKVTKEFELKNEGDADIQIQRIAPSCGCTAANTASSVIKPGEATKIKVEFDTSGFEGEKIKTVQVFTSDLDNPEITLSLKGVVLPSATIDPVRLEFGNLAPGADPSSWKKSFRVTLDAKSNLSVKSAKSYSKNIVVTEEAGSEPTVKNYSVAIDKSVPRGAFRDRVVIELSGARPVVLNVPVSAFVGGDLRLEPSTVSFGVIEKGGSFERSVKLENSGKEPLTVKGIQSSSDAVIAQLKEIKAGRLYVVHLTVDPSKVTKDLRASVQIETDRQDEEQLSLNVVGILPPR